MTDSPNDTPEGWPAMGTVRQGPPPPLADWATTGPESVAAPPAPDLPCPKCASNDTTIAYCDGCDLRPTNHYQTPDNACRHGEPEHFHRSCRRCGYWWRTDDAINPRKVCEK